MVGGGITGLSTALHAAEKGAKVILLEAQEPGWGASGRNGGQVNAGLKFDPDAVERDHGVELGRRMNALAGGAPAFVFDLVRRHSIRLRGAAKRHLAGGRGREARRRRSHLGRAADPPRRPGRVFGTHRRLRVADRHRALRGRTCSIGAAAT